MAEARILYLATDDGLIQLANPGRSDRWREIGRALTGQPVRIVVASPYDPLLAVAATADAVYRSTNGGVSWDEAWRGSVTALAFNDNGALYLGTKQGVLLHSPDGTIWNEVARVDGPINRSLAAVGEQLHFSDARTTYRLTSEGVQSSGTFAPEITLIGAVASPTPPQHVMVVGERSEGSSLLLTGALVVLGGNDPVLLVGTKGHLMRSVDSRDIVPDTPDLDAIHVVILGEQPTTKLIAVSGPQHVTALVSPPRFLDQAFAGTARGELWFSIDRGRTWMILRTDLPPVRDLAFARAI